MDPLLHSRFLRYFTVVARQGSLRRAAEQLHVSASAIDRQILQAEAVLGLPLFERLPGGLRLTAAGEMLMASGQRWAVEAMRLREALDDLTGLRHGHVRVATIGALANGFLARQLALLQQNYPGITAEIRVMDSIAVPAALSEGAVDLGLMLDPQSTREIRVVSHHAVVLGFVTPPDHPMARRPSARFAAALDERILLPLPPLAVHEQLRGLQVATGITLTAAAQSDNVGMLKAMILAGQGVGLLSALDVMEEVRSGLLAFVPIAERSLRPMTLALCMREAGQLSAAAGRFVGQLQQGFADL